MMRTIKPSILYKYKSASSEEDMKRIEEILVDKQLFFPNLKQLNDPMEACSAKISLQISGSGYHKEAGMVHPIVEDIQEEFGIMSFTAIPNMPIMWAHYGNEYTGSCIVFSTEDTFSCIEPTIYSNLVFEINASGISTEELRKIIRAAIFYKNTDWAYENEWRYVEHRESEKISLGENDIKGLIVGEKMDEDKQRQIEKICKTEGFPCFRTYVMRENRTIGVVPIEYKQTFITHAEISKYMENKKLENRCVDGELELFNTLNSNIGWAQ